VAPRHQARLMLPLWIAYGLVVAVIIYIVIQRNI
jgi:hypothetical protein